MTLNAEPTIPGFEFRNDLLHPLAGEITVVWQQLFQATINASQKPGVDEAFPVIQQ